MKLRRNWTMMLMILLMVIGFFQFTPFAAGQSAVSQVGGLFNASQFNQWRIPISVGNAATGVGSITLNTGQVSLPDGRTFVPFSTTLFAPITINDGTLTETVTPTAVSGCAFGTLPDICTITASFANIHGRGATVVSGTFGLGEAIIQANIAGGGTAVVDNTWGGVSATITGIVLATPKVWVQDQRGPGPVTWYGKSGVAAAAYSASNNDMVFSGASPVAKTFSQTYTVAPVCTGSGTTGAVTALTTTTTSASATCTGTCSVQCAFAK